MFYPQGFFDWDGEWGPGIPEPTAGKWMTNDGFYLWEKSEPKYEDFGECRCFANSPEYEEFCETTGMDEGECVFDDRCHWGPGENAECESANHFEDPEDWADEETIQDWAVEEMDPEEVAYVIEEQ